MTLNTISENESGIRAERSPDGSIPIPIRSEAYSIETSRTGFAGQLGPGFLIRLTSNVNLDLGGTVGLSSWGEPHTRVAPDYLDWNSSKTWYVLGSWL